MRDIDNDIRASLERLTDPHGKTPGTEALWGDLVARRRKRRNRNRTLAALPLLLVAVLAVGVFSAQRSEDARSDVAAGGAEPTTGGDITASDEVPPEVSSASCVTEFSAQTLRDRAFAFDGSVVKVGTAKDPRAPEEVDVLNATFEVHKWFAGGTGKSVTVWMQRPVELGERLLVAGEPRWGGAPLEDAIAWECGFTVAHSETRSGEWSAAFTGTDGSADDAVKGNSSLSFEPFTMRYRTTQEAGTEFVWTLDYTSVGEWSMELVSTTSSASGYQVGATETFKDGEHTIEFGPNESAHVEEEERDEPVAPLQVLSRGPIRSFDTLYGQPAEPAVHEGRNGYETTETIDCPEGNTDEVDWCGNPGGQVTLKTFYEFNSDGVPVLVHGYIEGTNPLVWRFEVLDYERKN